MLFSMRIDLGQLSAQDLTLALPATEPGAAARDVTITSAEALRGTYLSEPDGFQLQGLSSARIALAKLHWFFGKLKLQTEQAAVLSEVTCQVRSSGQELELALGLGGLEAVQLHVETATLTLTAQLEARGLRLDSREGVGLLTAEQAVFHS